MKSRLVIHRIALGKHDRYQFRYSPLLVMQADMYWRARMLRAKPKWVLAAVIPLAFCLTTPVYAQSEADCAARAERAEREANSVMGGTAVGALGGAGVGPILGGNKKSAKRGAVLGAVAGGATNAVRKNNKYKEVYDDCMASRQSQVNQQD